MDYRTITDRNSKQYKLLQEGFEIDEYGQLEINGYKVVAMGFDGVEVGNKYRITLSSGTAYKVIIGDIKHQGCTSSDGSMIEHIVDVRRLNDEVKILGNFNAIYEGTIEKIEKIEKEN